MPRLVDYWFSKLDLSQTTTITLITAVGSKKFTHLIDAPRQLRNLLLTNKVSVQILSSLCTSRSATDAKVISMELGYSNIDVNQVPDGANMGLGCGDLKAIASLKPSETVLDLGSGGGFDYFLAVNEVGESGMVIGVDMTPTMVSKARANADKSGYNNVDFGLEK